MGDEHEKKIQHFSHQHSLMFKEELEYKNKDTTGHPPLFCDGCGDQVFGPSYRCFPCSSNKLFILHKSCAELPPKIHHPIHGKHPLVLYLTSSTQGPGEQKNNTGCDACQQDCKGSFIYHCSQCKFNLDLKCASNWRNIIGSSSHDHNFIILMKPMADVTCDVCGFHVTSDGDAAAAFHLCSICQLLVHKECSWLRSHVQIPSHQHSLRLTWYFEDTYPKGYNHCYCCFRSVDGCHAVYYCHEEGCTFVAHNSCAINQFAKTLLPKPPKTASADDGDDNENDNDNVNDNDNDEPLQVDNKQMQLEEDLPKTINKFGHSLTLMNISNVDRERTIICDGCRRPSC